MTEHGGILNAYYQVKEANLKRLHTVGFQLYDILEKAELWRLVAGRCWVKGEMSRWNTEKF